MLVSTLNLKFHLYGIEGMASQSKERRAFKRVDSEHLVMVRSLSDSEQRKVTKTRVVGEGGCMFTAEQPYGRNAFLDMLIHLKGGVFRAHGRVAYERRSGEGEVEVGVDFLHYDSMAREALRQVVWGV